MFFSSFFFFFFFFLGEDADAVVLQTGTVPPTAPTAERLSEKRLRLDGARGTCGARLLGHVKEVSHFAYFKVEYWYPSWSILS